MKVYVYNCLGHNMSPIFFSQTYQIMHKIMDFEEFKKKRL